jgi:hypothetical protein
VGGPAACHIRLRAIEMTGLRHGLLELAAKLLPREQREAVRGDLAESGETGWSGLAGIGGLFLRSEVASLRSWRPWLASVGLAFPTSFLLMGLSVAVSQRIHACLVPASERCDELAALADSSTLIFKLVVLTMAGWADGLAIGWIARRTVWLSAALSLLPCLFCFSRFRVEALSPYSLFLFVPAAAVGVFCGLRVAGHSRTKSAFR